MNLTEHRARVKQTIADLEKRVELLSQELHLTRLENASLQERNQLAPPGTIPSMAPPQSVPGPEDFPEGTAAIMDVVVRRNTQQPQQCMGMGSQFSDSMVVAGQICSGISFPCFEGSRTYKHAEPGRQTIMDPSLFYLYDNFEQQPISIPVWDARPVHYPATCRLDKVILEMIDTLKPLNAIGGNTLEFTSPKFPHVQALLNPQHHANSFPLTTAIVQVSQSQPLHFLI